MIYLQLFTEFFKTGLFSVGGGLATLPFLYEMSDKTHWFTHSDVADMIAISESTPGAIGINMSTYAGYITAGFSGGVLATLSLAAPSVIIILIISAFLQRFQDNRHVQNALFGLRPASLAMITAAGLNVAKIALFDLERFLATRDPAHLLIWKGVALAVVIFAVQRKWDLHPVFLIAASAVVGVLFRFGGA